MATPELQFRHEAEERERELRILIAEQYDWHEIVDIAMGRQVPLLQKPGGKYDANCVFHEERSPSLRFWPDGGFYCHGCGESGDMLDFIRRANPGIQEEEVLEMIDPSGYRVKEKLAQVGHA